MRGGIPLAVRLRRLRRAALRERRLREQMEKQAAAQEARLAELERKVP